MNIQGLTLIDLIRQLRKHDSITQGQLKQLPPIQDALPESDRWHNEIIVANLTIKQVRSILELGHRILQPEGATRGTATDLA
jgi:hypothetical protein